MKKTTFAFVAVILTALPASVFAGYYDAPGDVSYSTGKSPMDSDYDFSNIENSVVCQCWDPDIIDIDIFAGYAWAQDDLGPFSDDGFTGGLGVQTFYSEMLGFRLQGTYWDSEDQVGTASGSVIFRYPLEGYCLAPYIYAGPGGLFAGDGAGEWTGHLGFGLDFRFDRIECLGIFLDFRRTWAEKTDGYYMLNLGLRLSL